MCGRYYTRRQKQEIAERLRVEKVFEEPFAPDYNIAPTTFQPIVRQEPRLQRSRDDPGALGAWFRSSRRASPDFKGFSTFNARAETIMSSEHLATGPFQLHRCLVPVDGFYEWSTTYPGGEATKSTKAVKGKALKKPFAISLKQRRAHGLCRLVGRIGRDPAQKDTPWLQSFAIITTEANEIMELHPQSHARHPGAARLGSLAEQRSRGSATDRPPSSLRLGRHADRRL